MVPKSIIASKNLPIGVKIVIPIVILVCQGERMFVPKLLFGSRSF